MTEKQEKILDAALQLFAKEGYHATSTSKVAKAAGVSEGLIFRHFENKQGLLESVLHLGEERTRHMIADIIMNSDPKEIIRRSIAMPFSVPEEDHDFWRLLFKLKWELDRMSFDKLEPLKVALTSAFKKLSYKNPELEAEFLLHVIDGISSALLRNELENPDALLTLIKNKYNI
ncbi:MAG: helix-turn-helix domain-containing protein [Saprospiraceae bacterium]|nr:helix-turn-helix domain-containing protein [Saprospiraceae bacterium]